MSTTFIESAARYGYDFISGEYIPPGEDEYYLRNRQLELLYSQERGADYTAAESKGRSAAACGRRRDRYRRLTGHEIQALERNGNTCPVWEDVWVTEVFNPELVKDCFFAGYIRIGDLGQGMLRYHDYILPVGITHSRIISCDIGDCCAIHDCRYISHYIIGDGVILTSINEMDTTNHAKFGEGILKEGEDEAVRIWIDPLNEAGGRSVLPFADMICADAYLWTAYRDDPALMAAFKAITQQSADGKQGYYGFIGSGGVIKHCHTIKDVRIGDGVYIKGANKLKNVTIKSDYREPTQIGEGVELVNGIVGYGCRIFYGCKAVRFVLGNNCNLKYGARLIHSILGDNSTVSCCEVLNNLVFPGHEQHHNNSFLIATMIMGQSNMAAGATVGSNHNSRGNDGEIIAGRGFWPGLSSALKHNSRFASYTLIAKGNYPAELHIPLPFSLVTNNPQGTRREVMPAYWWMYNMYALERNSWKYRDRDKRKFPVQYMETAYLAPDTVGEILCGLKLLREWIDQAKQTLPKDSTGIPNTERRTAPELSDTEDSLLIPEWKLERSHQMIKIIKPAKGAAAYQEMLVYYGVKTLTDFFTENALPGTSGSYTDIHGFQAAYPERVSLAWENLGGQLAPESKVLRLREAIRERKLTSWGEIHAQYADFLQEYPLDKALHALQILRFLQSGDEGSAMVITQAQWNVFLDEALRIRRYIEDQVYHTKLKDYVDPFRNTTYRNGNERDAVLGKLEDNAFIQAAKAESALFFTRVEKVRAVSKAPRL